MDLTEIESRTRRALPSWGEAELERSLIEKGGSGRIFVRVSAPASRESVIAVHYTDERPDNLRFAPVTAFLERHGVPVPRLLASREDLGLAWVEDLGSVHLGDLAGADWETVRRPAYEATLREVVRLHRLVESDPPADLPELEPPFDEALYAWEQRYFLEEWVTRFLGAEAAERLGADPSLPALREELASLPRALLHRDFQSSNVMIRDDDVRFIDYQGLRWGVPEYDVASLLYDPYVGITAAERETLAGAYHAARREAGDGTDEATFRRRLRQCATQRLMQALGAYGFLGEVKGKREFLRHVPTARERLVELSGEDGGLAVLGEVLGRE